MYEHLIVKEQGRLVEVHLNRPQVRHALSRALMREITALARTLSDRTDIDVVILTGDMRCFSAGADLNDAQAWADDSLSTLQRRDIAGTGFRMCKAWEEMPQITIAAIEGYAVGGGLALSLACDWRVLAQDAFVSLPEIALGIPLTWGTIPRLVNLLGPAKAKRLTILCERIVAPEALSLGLVDYVSERGQALIRAQALAAQTLDQPAATMRMSKESVNAAATALNHATSFMAHDQIALAASSPESRAARGQALR
jgi:enoyl-CoA hydratase/carnithine racemase